MTQINFDSTTPAPPTGGVNLAWQKDGSGNLSGNMIPFGPSGTGHSPGLVPDPGATAAATHYLREDGNWEIPATGSGAYPAGANIVPCPLLTSQTNGWGGYSQIVKIPAGFVAAFTSAFSIVYAIQGNATFNGATYNTIINKAVIRRTAPNSLTWIDSTSITWNGGSTNPSFTPGSVNVAQLYQSDAITLAMDAAHDYYIIVYVDPTTNVNAFQPYASGSAFYGLGIGGYISGDQTSTTNASTFSGLNGQLSAITQILTA
jgi:hypothetical protein